MTAAKQFLRRAAALAACVVLCILCLPSAARAYGPIDVDKSCSLTISHLRGHEEAYFRLYRVADVSADAQFTAARDFRAYQSRLKGQTASGWRSLARDLGSYVDYENIGWLRRGHLAANGQLAFSGLPAGLYLVVGERYEHEDVYYETEPFLICLPNWEKPSNGAGYWVYDVTVRPKYSMSEDDTVMRRVLKRWDDSGYQNQRPRSITVDLLRDGVVWDTVTLTERNSWRYVWDNLDNRYRWSIRERSYAGYSVSYGFEGVTFIVTNTYTGGNPNDPDDPNPPSRPPRDPNNPRDPGNPTTPGDPTNPPETELDDPDVPLANPPETELDDPDVPLSPPEIELDDPDVPLEDIPHTGQLWWPVPVMAVGGMFLFLVGWLRNRRWEADGE